MEHQVVMVYLLMTQKYQVVWVSELVLLKQLVTHLAKVALAVHMVLAAVAAGMAGRLPATIMVDLVLAVVLVI